MPSKSRNIAIITARGGSKRIPRKNIKPFLGIPIIKYSIDAAIESGCFDEIIVSTDDTEIANLSKSFGAKIPFLRSDKNSDDFATTSDVLMEVLDYYYSLNITFDNLCCIYPTAPFVNATKLSTAFKMLNDHNIDCVFPIVSYSYPVQRSLIINNGLVSMAWPENYSIRSQDFESYYHDCGQFYFMKISKFLVEKKLFMSNSKPIITSELEVQDIDNEDDWKIAELKYLQMINKGQ
jgi:pseudaminic acid cytidylyltransferase